LLEKRDTQEYRQVLGETIEDANELIRTFNALLEIAQANKVQPINQPMVSTNPTETSKIMMMV
jgi:hypothetical protein